tara:strand:+ start:211 stop:570 length:360 start_codon:yes stop_codon:yes gene_type:complete
VFILQELRSFERDALKRPFLPLYLGWMQNWIKPLTGHHATECNGVSRGAHFAYKVFPPEELERRLVEHQERVDAARNRGELLEDEGTYTLARAADVNPGFEKTPRGIRLGSPQTSKGQV